MTPLRSQTAQVGFFAHDAQKRLNKAILARNTARLLKGEGGMDRNSLRRLRILAVDDEQIMLDLYRDALFRLADHGGTEYEFEVMLRKQGDEAVEAVRKAKDEEDPFAVIFLDLRLPPGPDGIWAGEQIRNLDPYVNFVIVTGFFDVDPREIAARIPPEDKLLYVQKPFHVQEIRQFASSLGAKWHSEHLLRKAKLELENANNQLLETNNALSVLARNLERTRTECERRIIQRTRTAIMPVIERLQQDRNLERYRTDFELLLSYVRDLTSDLASATIRSLINEI